MLPLQTQSGPGSNGNEGVLHIPQSSSITEASPSDCLGRSLRESYPSAEMQSVYSTALANWARENLVANKSTKWQIVLDYMVPIALLLFSSNLTVVALFILLCTTAWWCISICLSIWQACNTCYKCESLIKAGAWWSRNRCLCCVYMFVHLYVHTYMCLCV